MSKGKILTFWQAFVETVDIFSKISARGLAFFLEKFSRREAGPVFFSKRKERERKKCFT